MKRKAQTGGRLKRLKVSVEQFVRKGEETPGAGAAREEWPQGTCIKRRSRKELRKEKRRLKKSRRKEYYEWKHLGGGERKLPGLRTTSKPSAVVQQRQKANESGDHKGCGKAKGGAGSGGKAPKRPGVPRRSGEENAAGRKRALLEANVQEEREIRRLEKSLRLHKRRNKSSLPQSFTRDGLDYILGALEPGASESALYESDEEMETVETLGTAGDDPGEEEEEESDPGGGCGEPEEESDPEEECEELENESEREEAGEELEANRDTDSAGEQKMGQENDTKYVPPHMRCPAEVVDAKKREELERLKKSVKGLLNRLSEPNMASISGQLEELYMTNSRNDMNETLTDVLMCACITPARMPDRLMMEHVLLASVLHCTVGIEVGAHVLESVVKKFDALYQNGTDGKECDNLITFIAHLYNFHVVESLLVFDILKKLVDTFEERDIELILSLLKNVGFSLRKDDPSALKLLISEVQNKASNIGSKFQDQSRVRFMLETMLALRNNDMRKIPGYDPELLEKLRKLQRGLSSRAGSDSRLRVSLESLLDADRVGRWWIIGSSWSGAPMIGDSSNKSQQKLPLGKVSSKILELARKQRMNTDIRRNIFCVLMSSEDFLDAFENLLKLGLKDQQEREIVHVLVDCCLQEKTYNPFYAFLASKFCKYDRRFQMTFQFSMWDKFRDLGSLSATTVSNLVHLLTSLLKTKSLSLVVFKVIEFSELDKARVSFLRQVLYKLLMETDPEELTQVFGRVSNNPKLGMLREGLKLFMLHFILKNVHANQSADEAERLKERVNLVGKALQANESRLKL
ncbi:nucleolar MIF4G domain-containing protein 1 isoform X2 [Rhinatrema bivittatum]|uniref:nucleolar MIF4G domain-containing protein 1 isoform X2 n=1 Tax=Rhinatrema bivittatum TaxID=194408 RepID=UPI0011263B02|nr:nucleolar MIF4G domain-containing protein 1 isoform X2 [Rhinatrema bivittatum]